jgi:hypothetical protein
VFSGANSDIAGANTAVAVGKGMREYENLAYIDLQKTGSTTIKGVLNDLLDEPVIHRRGHATMREDFDRSKLAFISVREPLSIYISLFSFASRERKGALYNKLCKNGMESLFVPTREAFEQWLGFVLDPRNAALLKADYALHAPTECIGLLSFRLLFLSVPRSLKKMAKDKFREPDQIRTLFGKRIYDDYVRVENLGGDLFRFLAANASRLRLRHPLTTAEDMIARIPVKNVSRKIADLVPENVSPGLRQLVREREWLFYEVFGYDADPKGRPPPL